MNNWPIADAPNPAEAGAALLPWPYDSCTRFGGWADLMKLNWDTDVIGEIRTSEDWSRLPRDIHLRVVFLVDEQGPVIRWGAPESMRVILGGMNHQHLLRGDGDLTTVRSGWVHVSHEGVITIQ